MRVFLFNTLLLLSNSIGQFTAPDLAFRFGQPDFYERNGKADPETTLEEYWDATAMGLDTYIVYLNTQKCYESDRYFIGCIKAIDVLLNLTDENLSAHPASQSHFILQTETIRFGNLVIGKFEQIINREEDRKLSKKQFYEKYEKIITNYDALILSELKNSETKIEFEKIISWLLTYCQSISKMAYGMSLNTLFVEGIDSHTSLMPTKYLADLSAQQRKKVHAGIGIEMILNDQGYVVIRKVQKGGPADKAGLKKYDIITKVNGEVLDVKDPNFYDKSMSIGGDEEDTLVTITIKNNDGEKDYTLIRKVLKPTNVSLDLIQRQNLTDTYLLKIESFYNPHTCKDTYHLISKIKKNSSIIMDLRNNEGGQLDQALCLIDLFSSPGHVNIASYDIKRSKEQGTGQYTKYNKLMTGKLVVLVNERSASASEVVSGFFMATEQAYVLGVRSWGKGTVLEPNQKYINLGLTFYETKSYFFVNNKWTPHRIGVTPDFEYYDKPVVTEDEKYFRRESETFRTSAPHVGPEPKNSAEKTEKIKSLQTCIDTQGKAETIYTESLKTLLTEDYQVERAVDLIQCL